MITNFNEQLFIDFDLEIAVFIENLVGWIRTNAAKDKMSDRNFHEGRHWSYNSYSQFSRLFIGWSPKTIRTIVARCVKEELILVGNFNKKKYDNTNWYTLTDKALKYYPVLNEIFLNSRVGTNTDVLDLYTPARLGSTPAQTGRPIPELLTIRDLNTTTSELPTTPEEKPVVAAIQKSKKTPNAALVKAMIDIYREEFPNNPQPHKTLLSPSLERTLQTFIKRWPEADPDGMALDAEGFRRYMQMLKVNCPGFALSEYETKNGNRKKNNLETFCRWNTFVKFLEDQYS